MPEVARVTQVVCSRPRTPQLIAQTVIHDGGLVASFDKTPLKFVFQQLRKRYFRQPRVTGRVDRHILLQ